jgi:hypothetical protein
MKSLSFLPPCLALVFTACETGQVADSGDFDPLTTPGSRKSMTATSSGFKPGKFVRTNMDNVAFFKVRPKGNANADRQLPNNTEMKVISDDGDFVKGELNSGEIGYVPSVLVSDEQAGGAQISADTIQVYPPLLGDTLPGGGPTIPSVIDPEAPLVMPQSAEPALPEAPPIPSDEIIPPAEPTPLPPGNEAGDKPPEPKAPESTPAGG